MEGNISSSDDETQSSPISPKQGGKKQKLNDGSSQDSEDKSEVNDAVSTSREDKDHANTDRSDGNSEDRTAASSSGPSNELVNIGPSSSNVGTILLSLRRPVLNWRNYRKRRPPGSDSDSNDASSFDSDDNSAEEERREEQRERHSTTTSEPESDVLRMFSDDSPTATSSSSTSSNYQYDSDDQNIAIDSDSDDVNIMMSNNGGGDDENKPAPSVLLKTRPKHNYCILREIINREMGASFPTGNSAKSDVLFEKRFYGSLHAIYRLKKLHHLNKHRGCVNSINFHPEGHLLASGSDDTNVVVWDWARNKALDTIKTGHKSNVFQSKFLYLNAQSQLNIVTCARDGQVRLLQCPPSGGGSSVRRRLCSHARAAHKLHVSAHEPHSVVSCGEDGLVMHCDVRHDKPNKLFHVKDRGMTIPLYSVHGHPLEPKKLLVAGRDKFLKVYDTRKSLHPIALYCPSLFVDNDDNKRPSRRSFAMHLTCAVYNHDGSEILGSYNDEDIYLFDAVNDVYDKDHVNEEKEYMTHRYSGHRNSATFKGVSFFGPKSEYVVSGSDCSYIYVWDKQTEAIVQWTPGDVNGVVNCIEAHPRCPVLASSGLDKDIKIWMAKGHRDPDFNGLERVVRENSVSQLRSPLFNDFLPSLYEAWRGDRSFVGENPSSYGGNIEFDGNVCAMF